MIPDTETRDMKRFTCSIGLALAITCCATCGCEDPNDPGTTIGFIPTQVDPASEDSAGPVQVKAVDLDRDGLTDLVSAWNQSQPIQIHLQRRSTAGDIDFDTFTIGGAAPMSVMADVETADIDEDGRLDVVVLVEDTGYSPPEGTDKLGLLVIFFAPQDPSEPFDWETMIFQQSMIGSAEESYTDMAIGDVDGAGGPDIIVGLNRMDEEGVPTKDLILYRNPGPANARSDGVWTQVLLGSGLNTITACELIDVDHDGDLDAVAAHPEAISYNLRLLVNPLVPDGLAAVITGWWSLRPIGQLATGADGLMVADVDDDGRGDIIARSEDGLLIQWFRGPEDPITQTFPWEVYTLVTFSELAPSAVTTGDINNDGQLDLVAAAAGALRWFTPYETAVFDKWDENMVATDGNGEEAEPTEIKGLTVIDIDNDGRQDIIATLDRDGVADDALIWFHNAPIPFRY